MIEVRGRILTFDEECMGFAVEAVMRRLSEAAADFDAALEVRVVREARSAVVPEEIVAALFSDLRGAGFPASTGVSWLPATEGEVRVGVGANGESSKDFEELLEACGAWEVV